MEKLHVMQCLGPGYTTAILNAFAKLYVCYKNVYKIITSVSRCKTQRNFYSFSSSSSWFFFSLYSFTHLMEVDSMMRDEYERRQTKPIEILQ